MGTVHVRLCRPNEAAFVRHSSYGRALRIGEELPMHAFTYVAIASIAAAMSMPTVGDAFAQAGSTGGSVGKTSKSISGGVEAAPPARRASQPARRKEQATTSSSFDGSWAGMSVGPCIGHFGWNVQVSNGVISGSTTTGRIARNGATNGDMVVMGKHFLFKGMTRASGNASGTWRSPNCSGSWTAVRS